MSCPFHKVVSDPDPHDSFCSDDEAVLCTKMLPTVADQTRWYDKSRFEFKPITVSCRPYNKRKECETPSWCPL